MSLQPNLAPPRPNAPAPGARRSAGASAPPVESRGGRQVLSALLERRFPGVFARLAELRGTNESGRWSRIAAAARFSLARAAALLGLWRDRARTRSVLQRMSELDLHDIGLSRSQIIQEMNKPFWRA